jgi:hypothetical protein
MAITLKQVTAAYESLSNAHSRLLSCPVGDAWEAGAIDAVITCNGDLSKLLRGKMRATVREETRRASSPGPRLRAVGPQPPPAGACPAGFLLTVTRRKP